MKMKSSVLAYMALAYRQIRVRFQRAPGYLTVGVLLALMVCCGAHIPCAYGVDIADTPLSAQLDASAPNVMFGLDDSGSMDWEIMTDESAGLFDIGGTKYEYIFDPGDNLYTHGYYSHRISGSDKRYWKSQWFGKNVMYYNPGATYNEWYDSKDPSTGIIYTYPVDIDTPRSHGFVAGVTLNMDGTYYSYDGVTIRNAHYYVQDPGNHKVYLVNLTGSGGSYQKQYYEATISSDKVISLASVATPALDTGRSAEEERRNFAHWFTNYRRRRSMAVTVLGELVPRLAGMKVGIRSINGHIKQPVVPIQVGGVDKTDELRHALYSYVVLTHGPAATPLRTGLEKIGQYYSTTEVISPHESEFNVSPIDLGEGGACQQNFAIMFTDGAYNGNAPGMGNVDDTDQDKPGGGTIYAAAPYQDGNSGSLADTAYYYWFTDLDNNPNNNLVPAHDPPDPATWQHMVTYTISFGVKGTLNPDDYVLYCVNPDDCVYPDWPSPINSDPERIDDVWHAAVDGRGLFLNANNPSELYNAFADIIADVISRVGTAASVTVNGDKLQNGLAIYQSKYDTDGWIGYVYSFGVDPITGQIQNADNEELFEAGSILDNTTWTDRKIVTYDDDSGGGIAFTKSAMPLAHWQRIDTDSTEAQKKINFLRGDRSNEGPDFRIRKSVLGDVVHASPTWYDNTIYVGANDGMMHAFQALEDPNNPPAGLFQSDEGKEIFAYVPNLVTDKLSDLTDTSYSHQYYVDRTVFVRQRVPWDESHTVSLLTGGLGAGGQGYYCLDVTNVHQLTDEAAAANLVKWEYPSTPGSDADMGYTYGIAYPVKTHAGWKVIFGNGYNSANGHAVLYSMDLDASNVMKIDTGVGDDNGLSCPNVAYADNDDTVDYVYAGDLKGNMWKFDLMSSDPGEWKVAYKNKTTDLAQPLFTATDAAGDPQPITVRPAVIAQCNGYHGLIVIFATGRYLGTTDFSDTQTQTMYGVWDYGDDDDDYEYLGTYDRSSQQFDGGVSNFASLLEQKIVQVTTTGLDTVRVMTSYDINYLVSDDLNHPGIQYPDPSTIEANNVGWYIDLPTPKERVYQDPTVRDNLAYFVSFIPETGSACQTGGESWLWEVNACSGGRYYSPVFDVNGDAVIDNEDIITVTNDLTGEMGIDPDNPSSFVSLPGSAVHFNQEIFMPPFVTTEGGMDLKYISDSGGGASMVRNKQESRGMIFWKEM